jgi:isopenicillin N synthase-like dioxygenase
MARLTTVPCVNIQQFTQGTPQEAREFTNLFGQGLKEFGFVVVEGHGIDPALIRQAYAKVKAFFDLPPDIKATYDLPGGGGQRAYTGFGKEHAKNNDKGDLKEFWHVGRETYTGPEKLYPPNVWPESHVPEFKTVLQGLYERLDGFASTLLEATSLYLGLQRHVLPKMVKDGNSILRCIHYPAVTGDQFQSGAVRAAAHEDINFITILCEATESGLELLTRDGRWMSVESGPGQMVVDSGDMLSRICNDVIPSTTHRVVNPPGGRNVPRYSMPFFVHPYSSCQLEILDTCKSPVRPPLHAPILADEFLRQRLREIGLIHATHK